MPCTVEAEVKSQKGHCAFGHKVGDKIIFDGRSMKGEICYGALLGILPRVYALRFGTDFPYAKNKDTGAIYAACTDYENPVVFEIRRVKK